MNSRLSLSKFSRRKLIEAAGVVALTPQVSRAAKMPEPRFEGKDTPKICLGLGDGSGGLAPGGPPDAGMKRIKQLGVDYRKAAYGSRWTGSRRAALRSAIS